MTIGIFIWLCLLVITFLYHVFWNWYENHYYPIGKTEDNLLIILIVLYILSVFVTILVGMFWLIDHWSDPFL
jgi:uncharacterized membrane protein YphA (DoxX/SURF4 family)